MDVGRDLDALVAEKVMGLKVSACRSYAGIPNAKGTLAGMRPDFVRPYSTYIAAAWTVVEKMRALGFLVVEIGIDGGSDWTVTFSKEWPPGPECACKPTISEAICEAALIAVGEDGG